MANFFNEMYVDGGAEVRPHYRAFEDWLAEQPSDMLARKRAEADLIFRRVGITFAVYGSDAGTERLIPFDIIPRIIPLVRVAATTNRFKTARTSTQSLHPRYLPRSKYRKSRSATGRSGIS